MRYEKRAIFERFETYVFVILSHSHTYNSFTISYLYLSICLLMSAVTANNTNVMMNMNQIWNACSIRELLDVKQNIILRELVVIRAEYHTSPNILWFSFREL